MAFRSWRNEFKRPDTFVQILFKFDLLNPCLATIIGKEPMSKTELKYSSCYFCTSMGCAMKVYVKDGTVQRVAVDTKAPVVPGAFCVRPILAKEYQYHPFRLSFPMKRSGDRGANQWQQISWEQALDEISEKLQTIRRPCHSY